MRKLCYERMKIKNFHKCYSTFLIPTASFLQSSWISTVTFHLCITSCVFPSTHYRPVQDEYHVSWVCMAGPNCLCVTTLRPRHITYITIHDTNAVLDFVLLLHNTKFGMLLRLTVQCHLNEKNTYVSTINYSL